MRLSSGRRRAGLYASSLVLLVLGFTDQAFATSIPDLLTQTFKGKQASGIVVDLGSGSTLAASGQAYRATPGSVLKPLLLAYALEHAIVTPQTQVFCRRALHVGTRSLPCTHPEQNQVFIAEDALAQSCNTYFAELARRFSTRQLDQALRQAGIPHASLDGAKTEDRELVALGLEGSMVSPLQLAMAYRRLVQSIAADGPVARGLAASVNYGMANAAAVPGLTILGKTGTASNPQETWTHGWFVGVLPQRLVLVVFVPRGDGGSAALLAKEFFRTWQSAGSAR